MWMGGGIGNNTRDELIILWGILSFDYHIDIDALNCFGDSKVIVE